MPSKRRRGLLAPADPVDAQGRWYLEIPVLPPGPTRVVVESYPALECVDCSAPIRHGRDRHFARATDPTDVVEPVCGACGDRQIVDA